MRQPRAMALAASPAVSVPLNLSGTMSNFNVRKMAVYFEKATTGSLLKIVSRHECVGIGTCRVSEQWASVDRAVTSF
jgi:hypothetical protein